MRSERTLTRRALPENLPPWGILVLESHHAPDFFMEWRRHPFLKIIYALQGAGTLFAGEQKFAFQANDVLIVPSEVRNRIVDSPLQPSSLYVLCLKPLLLSFDPSIQQRLTLGCIPRSRYVANRVEASLRRLLFQQTHGGQQASIAMAAATLELIQTLTKRESARTVSEETRQHSRGEVARYVEFLDSHFFEAESIDAAAQKLGMSRRTFTKRFKEVTGHSWLEYVRSKAIDHAAELLLESSAPIASVAFECGFSDLSTFYRQFKTRMGVTPATWREQQ